MLTPHPGESALTLLRGCGESALISRRRTARTVHAAPGRIPRAAHPERELRRGVCHEGSGESAGFLSAGGVGRGDIELLPAADAAGQRAAGGPVHAEDRT